MVVVHRVSQKEIYREKYRVFQKEMRVLKTVAVQKIQPIKIVGISSYLDN